MKKLTLILLSVLMIVTLAACGNKCEHTYDNACDATCKTCGETREVSAHQWNDATCTTLKTCTVCQATEGEMLPHNWEDATCITAKTCKTCGTTEGEPLGHKPAEDDGDCGTDVLCTVCGAVTTPARLEHIAHANDGDCTTPITCTECGWLMKPAQEHNFNGDWKTDADGHWQMCQNIDCKVAGTKVSHTATSDNDCTTDDKCACGYTVTAAKDHVAGADDGNCETPIKCVNCEQDAKAAATGHNDADHDYTCDNAGCQVTVGNPPKDESDGIDLPIDTN